MTAPEPAAWIGVPVGTPMSIPGWSVPQRMPKGLVIGPESGQMKPVVGAAGSEEPADAAAHDLRLRSRDLHLQLRACDGAGDLFVLRRDRAEIVELVEHIVEVARGEQDVDSRRLVLLEDVDQAQVEAPEGELVLVLEV